MKEEEIQHKWETSTPIESFATQELAPHGLESPKWVC